MVSLGYECWSYHYFILWFVLRNLRFKYKIQQESLKNFMCRSFIFSKIRCSKSAILLEIHTCRKLFEFFQKTYATPSKSTVASVGNMNLNRKWITTSFLKSNFVISISFGLFPKFCHSKDLFFYLLSNHLQ